MQKNLIIIISGPSGVGKTTLLRFLPEKDFYFSVSHTTRPPRPGEIDGKDYYFVDEKTFLQMIAMQEFLEWVKVHDAYYGTAKSEIEKAFSQNKHLVLDIEVIGATRLKTYFGNQAVFIFIAPPSMEELEKRLIRRRTDNKEKIKKRLERAKEELKFASWFDYVIVNENLEESKNMLFNIINAEMQRTFRNQKFIKFLSEVLK
ncbi:MAG: guanylate kinase [Thermodesulfobacteriota bacterium]|nr:MAG: guanylate kinase [Thermodesulfobacteriota bacterium]